MVLNDPAIRTPSASEIDRLWRCGLASMHNLEARKEPHLLCVDWQTADISKFLTCVLLLPAKYIQLHTHTDMFDFRLLTKQKGAGNKFEVISSMAPSGKDLMKFHNMPRQAAGATASLKAKNGSFKPAELYIGKSCCIAT